MSKISGIYAASMSILNDDLTLNVKKTIQHAEMVIENGCHGVAIFGSTGQAQLIPISEKINLLNDLSLSKYKDKYIIGTGLNSLGETVNLMRVAESLKFKKFLIMPPAYYKYGDKEVIEFYSKIVEAIPSSEIILYNFEKLSGFKFEVGFVKKLINTFPRNIVGCKDSSYNLYENLKVKNFMIFPGDESKLLQGLKIGCSGCISAIANVTHELAREVFDSFEKKKDQTSNEKLILVRKAFDKHNLISALHSYMSLQKPIYKNILPPLTLLSSEKRKILLQDLEILKFRLNKNIAA